MFRTRDFILIFSCIVFLVTAIGATVLVSLFSDSSPSSPVVSIDSAIVGQEYDAVIIAPDTLSREERVQNMRTKIAAAALISAPEPEVTVEDIVEVPVASSIVDDVASAQLECSNSVPYAGFWDARDLRIVEAEGAMLVVRDVVFGTSTIEQTIVQLPKRTQAAPGTSCIASDVIGIATDGSLIRNDEADLYRIFDTSTVIGYALDGFPIYGGNTEQTDSCGGASVAGQYAYYLNPERDAIINCFAAAPVNLP